MTKLFKNYWAVFVVLALCYWAVKTLFVSGFFTIHDDEQIARLFELDWVFRDGQIPARWVPHLGFGFGYPFFNFYPPFIYYLGELFHKIGFSFINSTKAVVFTGFLASALFMYLWVKNHFGKFAGIFSALLYTYASYHAVDIYVRGDIPEFFSFVFLPAVFWSLDLLFKTKKLRYVIILGIFLSLVVLTHSLIALPFLFFLIPYLLFLIFSKRISKSFFIYTLFSGVLSILLSMYFWLPVFLEKKFTLVDGILTRELANYKLHFVYLRQFWDSPWGYGGSVFGLEDGLSFQVGKLHLILSLLAISIIIFGFIKKRKISREHLLPFIIFLLFIFSLYMVSFYSQWIWDKITPLSYLQFPWRFLLFSAVFSSFLGGFFVYNIEKNFDKPISLSVILILSFILIFSSYSNFQPAKYLKVSDSFYTDLDDIKWRVSKMSFEFLPNGVSTKLSDIKTTQIDIDRKDIPKQPYKVLEGSPDIEVISDKSHSKIFKIKSKSKSIIQINTFSFPGWETKIDAKKVGYNDNNKLKLIVLDIPQGSHLITANFVNTMPRAVGNAISLVTVFNLIGFGLFKLWKK